MNITSLYMFLVHWIQITQDYVRFWSESLIFCFSFYLESIQVSFSFRKVLDTSWKFVNREMTCSNIIPIVKKFSVNLCTYL